MKVRFVCDSGANFYSAREEVIDTVTYFGLEDDEWERMTDKEKQKLVDEWAWERLEIYWTEVE